MSAIYNSETMRCVVRRMPFLLPLLFLGLLFLVLVTIPSVTPAGIKAGLFFLMGDGKIHLRNTQTGQEANVTLLNPDGSLNERAFVSIDRVFGFPTRERGEHISPRLIFMLDYFSDLAAPGKVINLESGYRSPHYNSKIRSAGGNVARTSVHMDGMALDFSIDGVSGKGLWDLIRSANCCGVGHYGGKIIHLDAARPRFWEAATSKVRTGESDYNRRIYLSTDFDRYVAGDTVRLAFSGVSDFGFGIRGTVAFTGDAEGDDTVSVAQIRSRNAEDCVMISDRRGARFIHVTAPPTLSEGRYRIRIDFCKRPFEQMPLKAVSNEIEIHG